MSSHDKLLQFFSVYPARYNCNWISSPGPKGQPLFIFTEEDHKDELFLYTKVCLDYFKTLGQISHHSIPKKSSQHLLPITKDILLFPGKVQVFRDKGEEKLIVADTGNNRLLIMDTTGNVEHIIGDYAPGFKDGSFKDARFYAPQGMCFYDNSIYVADSENHAIRKVKIVRSSTAISPR